MAAAHLGTHHPTILRAAQGLIAAEIMLYEGDDEQEMAKSLKEDVETIVRAQETRPGWDHPDRLGSLLTLMMLQLISNGKFEDIRETCDELFCRLRKDEVRDQRLFSCLKFEERVAQLVLTRIEEFDRGDVGELLTTIAHDAENHATDEDDMILGKNLTDLAAQCREALVAVMGIKGDHSDQTDLDELAPMVKRPSEEGF